MSHQNVHGESFASSDFSIDVEWNPDAPEAARRRDLAAGSARLAEVRARAARCAAAPYGDVIGRVFHGVPGRHARASFGAPAETSGWDPASTRELLHFGSYNYSGLNGHPRVVAAAEQALRRYGTTVSGVRLLNGTCELHLELERALARFLGTEDCVTYSSGYAANLSALPALCEEGDLILADTLNHHSLVEAQRLSRAEVRCFRHRSRASLEARLREHPRARRKFIVTDGVFSMDGDVADLPAIVALAEAHDAYVVVDDAHGTAAIGPNGRGTPAHFGLQREVDVLTGSLSKGLPGIGGFAAGAKATIDLLRFGSSGYVFSASLPPPVAAGVLEALRILEETPELQERLRRNESVLRAGIRRLGLDCLDSESPIIPILMPDEDTTVALARLLHLEGLYVNPVGYPAVSRNRPRLRLNVSANLEDADLERFLAGLERCCRRLRIGERLDGR